MSYATQIVAVTGTAGQRKIHTFTLGVESNRHRATLRNLLCLDALDRIEQQDEGVEVDADAITQSLRNAATLIDMIEEEGLRQPLAEFRDFWFQNHQKPIIAFAQLA